MGLTKAFKGVDAAGVAQFDASSMVAWREREKLDRMKAEDIEQAQVPLSRRSCFLFFTHAPEYKGQDIVSLLSLLVLFYTHTYMLMMEKDLEQGDTHLSSLLHHNYYGGPYINSK